MDILIILCRQMSGSQDLNNHHALARSSFPVKFTRKIYMQKTRSTKFHFVTVRTELQGSPCRPGLDHVTGSFY